MKITFDKKADALYIKVKQGKVRKTAVHDSFILDLGKSGELLGIEVLNYSKFAASEPDKYSISLGGTEKLIHA